jgi:hypothetical protein
MNVKFSFAALLITGLFASSSYAEAPCDFKGVSVGDKLTPAEIMKVLGVTKYKMNPKFPSTEELLPNQVKYGTPLPWNKQSGISARPVVKPHAESLTVLGLA